MSGGGRLEGIELVTVRLPLAEPWVTAMGTVETRRVTLVRAVVDGAEGWGECAAQPEPTYTSEYEEAAWAVLADHLVPRLVAAGVATGAAVGPTLGAVKGHRMAKAALEAAVLDAELRVAGTALVDALRAVSLSPGPARTTVGAGVAVGVAADVGTLVDEVLRRVDEGYRRVKLKVHPGWDVAPVGAVRRAVGDGVALQVDANGSYAPLGPDGAAVALALLDDLGLSMVEQPLGDHDLVGHARLGARLATPLCLDEALGSDAEVASALALGACRVVNIKPGRLGGLLEAVRVHDRCMAAGVPVWCGGMLETGVGRAANIALASLAGFSLPGDLSSADRWWRRDIVDPPARLGPGGTLEVPPGPGSGVTVSLGGADVTRRAWWPAG